MIDTLFVHAYIFLFGGPTGVFSASDLINGFDSDLNSRVSPYMDEDPVKGNAIYLDSWVSPILSTRLETNTLSAYTENAQIYQMNGLNHTNKIYQYYDGKDL